MADRKYASDYRMEDQVDAQGRVRSVRVYRGSWYRFSCGKEEARRRGLRLLLCGVVLCLCLLPLLLSNTAISHTAYVLLPMAFVLIPVYHLVAVGWRMRTYEEKLTRQQKDLTQGRLHSSCIWLVVLAGVTLAGGLVYWLRQGLEPGDSICIAGLAAAFGLSLYLMKRKHDADTLEVQE